MRKLVGQLPAAGLVDSVRGKTGGVRLAKKAKEISLIKFIKRSAIQH
ncbi:MAG: Rrf2 family transcriptional regulator [Bdellovibrio sp.]|nr:Rrf2 family transcriptional regulator [Bdellovibrio sp.]